MVGEPAGPMCNTFLICAFVTSRVDYCNLFYLAMLPGAWGKNPGASKKVAACFLGKTGQYEPSHFNTVLPVQAAWG